MANPRQQTIKRILLAPYVMLKSLSLSDNRPSLHPASTSAASHLALAYAVVVSSNRVVSGRFLAPVRWQGRGELNPVVSHSIRSTEFWPSSPTPVERRRRNYLALSPPSSIVPSSDRREDVVAVLIHWSRASKTRSLTSFSPSSMMSASPLPSSASLIYSHPSLC